MSATACKHIRVSTTPLGAVTNTGWTCQDCGTLISKEPAPDQVTAASYVSPDGYSISRNHDGDALLLQHGKPIALVKELLRNRQK